MKLKPIAGIVILIMAFMLNCSRNYANIKDISESESKATKRELVDNWPDYDIWLYYPLGYIPPQLTGIIFDPNNDDRKILLGTDWHKVKDQQMWTEVVKENTKNDGDFKILSDFPDAIVTLKEIWGPDNQLYGYAMIEARYYVYPRIIEANTVRLEGGLRGGGGSYH